MNSPSKEEMQRRTDAALLECKIGFFQDKFFGPPAPWIKKPIYMKQGKDWIPEAPIVTNMTNRFEKQTPAGRGFKLW